MDKKKLRIGIAILIMLVPFLITGLLFNTSTAMGGLLISDYIMKTIALMLGLVVLYDALKE